MRLKNHVIAGIAGSIVFYPFFGGVKTAIFFISSFMIDADHYLDYLWKTRFKDWSPARMFRYCYAGGKESLKDENVLAFALLHTAEAFIVLYILARFVSDDYFIPIIAGMAYHIIFDVLWATYHGVPTIRPFSITEYLIRKRIMKKKGLDPDGFYKKMFELSDIKKK